MGAAVQSLLHARRGNPDKARELFTKNYRPNEVPPFGLIAETAGGINPYFATGPAERCKCCSMALAASTSRRKA
jgi:hypothetical protein